MTNSKLTQVGRRVAPALALLIISPLIAEFLLGDFNIRQIGFLAVFIPVYGAGAVLIREMTRRARRGWPTMLLLALAYALILEGFTNQTLFNPNYAGQRLLDYGFIPVLGTSFHFAVYVLTLHCNNDVIRRGFSPGASANVCRHAHLALTGHGASPARALAIRASASGSSSRATVATVLPAGVTM